MDYLFCKNCGGFTVPRSKKICNECKQHPKDYLKTKYRGVVIHTVKEEIGGTNFREKANGSFVDRKPDYNVFYAYAGGHKEYTRQDVVDTIEELYQTCVVGNGSTQEEFEEAMNTDTPVEIPQTLKWSKSTRDVFELNIVGIPVFDFLHVDPENKHLEILKSLVDDLKSDNKMMLEDFGPNDKDVKNYTKAIKEMERTLEEYK